MPPSYVHTGTLFRAYPGPWQVLRSNPLDPEDSRCVWVGEQRPSLKEVAMEILPNAHTEVKW